VPVTVRVNAGRLQRLLAVLPARAHTVVDTTSEDVRTRANQTAPRDTGSLAESLYVSNGEDSDYAQRAGAARARNSDAVIVQEVRPEFVLSLFANSADAYLVVVGSAVAHALPQEFGTAHMGPQAFMIPAVEGIRGDFIDAMSNIANI
jgi:hypothetical protein